LPGHPRAIPELFPSHPRAIPEPFLGAVLISTPGYSSLFYESALVDRHMRIIPYVGVTTSHGRRHTDLEKIMRTQQLDFVQLTYNMLDREAENI